MKSGFFIAIDGIDGCGSTTQTELLGKHMKSKGYKVHLTKEPSNSDIGNLIRLFLKKKDTPGPTDALLFAADRIQHYYREILPKLNENFIVISDRYLESSIAYQTVQLLQETISYQMEFEFNNSLDWVENINKFAPNPDITIILDIEPKISLDRKISDENFQSVDKYEDAKFLEEVRKIYISRAESLNYSIINAEQPQEIIGKEITEIITKIIQYIP